VTLAARDGSVISDVHRQLERLPEDASHLVLSAGGNDVLHEIGILQEPVGTVGEALRSLADLQDRFDDDYARLIRAIRAPGLPTVLCTIYNPCSPDPVLQREAVTALCLFNDIIIRHARESRFPVIDLRAICVDIADFANAIEPSATGGAKIAEAVCGVILGHEFGTGPGILVPC
jgi:hypothetical protein